MRCFSQTVVDQINVFQVEQKQAGIPLMVPAFRLDK